MEWGKDVQEEILFQELQHRRDCIEKNETNNMHGLWKDIVSEQNRWTEGGARLGCGDSNMHRMQG